MLNIARKVAKAFILTPQGKCLIVRNVFAPFSRGWGLVGGGIYRHESPLQALVREIQEEVGITVTPDNIIKQVYRFRYKSELMFIRFMREVHLFLVFIPSEVPPHRGWEIRDAKWIEISMLSNMLSSYYRPLFNKVAGQIAEIVANLG